MVATITANPFATSVAAGTFGVQWEGYVQGTAMDDPSARFRLAGGVLADTETIPMWGGVGISESIAPNVGGPANGPTGGLITRATQIAAGAGQLTGFSVFDQDFAMVNNPQSPVPLAPSRDQVNFYRFGSQARVALAIDPALVVLEGDVITQPVSWDFTNQRLVPYVAAYNANVITASTRALVSGTYHLTYTTTSAHGLGVGDDIQIAGETPSAYNGSFTTIAGTTGSTIVVDSGLTVDPGASTVQGTLLAGGGAVPCKVLLIAPNNCMTVNYDPVTGFATWNRNGACALVQL